MGPNGEPSRSPLLGPAVPHRPPRTAPADAGGALPPFAPRRAQPQEPSSAPQPPRAPEPPGPPPASPPPPADPFSYFGGAGQVELEPLEPVEPTRETEAPAIADFLATELPQSETLQAARVPAAPAMSEEIGVPGEGEAYAEVADRLERIARALRDGGHGTLLASGDPLTALILGFAMGLAEGGKPGR